MGADASALVAALRRQTVEWAQDLGESFGRTVEGNAPRRSNELADSVEVGGAVETGHGAQVSVTVTAEHARHNTEGVGIYGPEGTPIRGNPRLAFDWPAAGGLVIVHSVKGYPGSRFWERSLEAFPSLVRDL